ncbi:hypothetical protein [Sulfolobus tengchongensis]|uniref:hypothetical protein n=1 Tax=Sulfolobus tengchongensis TaxID=207809 RepID=UPI0030D1B0AE
MVNILIEEYRKTYYETPNIERTNSWISSSRFLLSSNISIPVIVEYPIFNEVANFIFLDKSIGIIVEAKGWRNIKKINDYVVDADGKN